MCFFFEVIGGFSVDDGKFVWFEYSVLYIDIEE